MGFETIAKELPRLLQDTRTLSGDQLSNSRTTYPREKPSPLERRHRSCSTSLVYPGMYISVIFRSRVLVVRSHNASTSWKRERERTNERRNQPVRFHTESHKLPINQAGLSRGISRARARPTDRGHNL